MKPYILTTEDKRLFGGLAGLNRTGLAILIVAFLLIVAFFSAIHLFFKIMLCMCITTFFIAMYLKRKKLSNDSINLQIDETGITLREKQPKITPIEEQHTFQLTHLSWEEIKNVDVKVSETFAEMWIIEKANSKLHFFDLLEHGAVNYYTFRHKLYKFADSKQKIKCPLMAF
ncbi:MAG: hypothetical protein J6Y37_01700 [Paludibacteraceae bacterium]|nr:hypothetical protein [Paludibacteraceae bacterium]